jgi:hypothetical protein
MAAPAQSNYTTDSTSNDEATLARTQRRSQQDERITDEKPPSAVTVAVAVENAADISVYATGFRLTMINLTILLSTLIAGLDLVGS